MTMPALPPEGDESWYDHYAALDAAARRVGKMPATVYVASADATDEEKALAGPTYTCDGTADNVQIQAAIDFVRTWGGKVLLSPGWFYLAAPLQLIGQNNGAEITYRTTSLFGSGRGTTVLRPAFGITAAVLLSKSVQTNLADFSIVMNGNTHGIAGTSTADVPLEQSCAYFSTIKNIEVRGTFAGDNNGYALHLQNPFRIVVENFEASGTRNGVRLYTNGSTFHPGNSVFIRCFMNIFGSNGFAYRIESGNAGAHMNLCEFILCEALSNAGTGNTAVWMGGTGGVQHIKFRGSNLEQFDTVFHIEDGEDNVIDGNYWDVRTGAAANTTAFVRFGANAWNNKVSIGNGFTDHATRLVVAAAAAKPGLPNLIEHVKLVVLAGGAVTNAIATPASVVSRWVVAEGAAVANASTVVVAPEAAPSGGGSGGGTGTPERTVSIPWTVAPTGTSGSPVASYSGGTVMQGAQALAVAAPGGYMEWDVALDAGTYLLRVWHTRNNIYGIVRVLVDGVEVGTFDAYAAAFTSNLKAEFAGIALTAGRHTVRFQTDTRNASSSGLNFGFHEFSLSRQGA